MKNMTIEQVKKMVMEILDMNGKDDFLYAVGTSFFTDGMIIVSCTVTYTVTGEQRHAQDYEGSIFEELRIAKKKMVDMHESYSAKRIAEIEEELAKLKGVKA